MLQTGEAVGVYRVVTRVGTGATAEVYRIKHQRLQSEYALKVLHPRGPSDIRRLENEGVVQSKLHHPNIVQVMDVVEVGSSIGLIMEFVEGSDLATWLEDHKPSLSEALDLFDGIVRGVQHAHDAGLVHRDLKPANVLLQRVREGLIPKVSDFGIAKIFGDIASPSQTMQGIAMGTPRYMAPEQFTDAASVDLRADMFSLGCILYELVTGQSAFTPSNVFEAHDSARLAAYRPLPEGIPEYVAKAIMGCLEPDRDRRIPDCQILLHALGRPTHAKSTPMPVRVDATIPPPPERLSAEPTIGKTIAPPDATMATGGTLAPGPPPKAPPPPPVIEPVTVEKPPRSRRDRGIAAAGAAVLGLVCTAGLYAMVSAAPKPAIEPPVERPVVEVVPPAPAEPTPVPVEAAVAPAPQAAVAKPVERRPVKVEAKATLPPVTAPAPEVDPATLVKSALVVVSDAEALTVTCGTRSDAGTTSARPTKFPPGPCTVKARVNGETLTATIEIPEKATFDCTAQGSSLVCWRK